MLLSGRLLLLCLSIIVVSAGVVILLEPGARILAVVVAGCGLVSLIVLNIFHPPERTLGVEPDDIDKIASARRKELVRGTSLYLREMGYRYSIRAPSSGDGVDRRCFTTEVNTVRLGFIPSIVIDNTTDRQGYGYIAYVYDGRRWRGPGLPCPDGQTEAVQHAARCVSPLATEEETRL